MIRPKMSAYDILCSAYDELVELAEKAGLYGPGLRGTPSDRLLANEARERLLTIERLVGLRF